MIPICIIDFICEIVPDIVPPPFRWVKILVFPKICTVGDFGGTWVLSLTAQMLGLRWFWVNTDIEWPVDPFTSNVDVPERCPKNLATMSLFKHVWEKQSLTVVWVSGKQPMLNG